MEIYREGRHGVPFEKLIYETTYSNDFVEDHRRNHPMNDTTENNQKYPNNKDRNQPFYSWNFHFLKKLQIKHPVQIMNQQISKQLVREQRTTTGTQRQRNRIVNISNHVVDTRFICFFSSFWK